MRPALVLLLLPIALAGCGPDSGFVNLTCRNKLHEDPAVKAATAASPAPDTDASLQQLRQSTYDRCVFELYQYRDPRGSEQRWSG